jgi:hypothetical protein
MTAFWGGLACPFGLEEAATRRNPRVPMPETPLSLVLL